MRLNMHVTEKAGLLKIINTDKTKLPTPFEANIQTEPITLGSGYIKRVCLPFFLDLRAHTNTHRI